MNVLKLWNTCQKYPFGNWLFGQAIRKRVPYTGRIHPMVRSLAPGKAEIAMRDRRRVRNHLQSVHAVALINLAEATSGLAFVAALTPEYRAILVAFEMRYLKKSRGTISAKCSVPPPKGEGEYVVDVDLTNAENDVVARARATWKVGKVPT